MSRFTQRVLVDEMGIAPTACAPSKTASIRNDSRPARRPAFRARFGLAGKRIVVAVGSPDRPQGFDQDHPRLAPGLYRPPRPPSADHRRRPSAGFCWALVDESGGPQHHLRGRLSDADLLSAYRSAVLFAMPNRTMPDGDTEGFGLTFLETNACGRAVVYVTRAGRSRPFRMASAGCW